MPVSLRLLILAGALLIIATILSYIHTKRILMRDATGWLAIALLLLFMAVFPGTVVWLSGKLGFLSPANFVFYAIIGMLTIKSFRDTAKISLMTHRIDDLARSVALGAKSSGDGTGDSEPSDCE